MKSEGCLLVRTAILTDPAADEAAYTTPRTGKNSQSRTRQGCGGGDNTLNSRPAAVTNARIDVAWVYRNQGGTAWGHVPPTLLGKGHLFLQKVSCTLATDNNKLRRSLLRTEL